MPEEEELGGAGHAQCVASGAEVVLDEGAEVDAGAGSGRGAVSALVVGDDVGAAGGEDVNEGGVPRGVLAVSVGAEAGALRGRRDRRGVRVREVLAGAWGAIFRRIKTLP